VNSDGKPDVLVANCEAIEAIGCNDAAFDGSVGVLLGNGDGTFRSVVAYDSGGPGTVSVAVADVNGDGKLDLVLADNCDPGCVSGGVVGVLLGKGEGLFEQVVSFDLPNAVVNFVAIADVNGDGKPDLLVATSDATGVAAVGVMLSNTTGGKSTTSTVLSSSLNPSTYGQKVTWTATVTSFGSVTPTGTIKFTWSGHTIGIVQNQGKKDL